jgi:predicted nucleotidyltransferase
MLKDLKEFIELLNSNGVEYLLVGGHAVAYHGYPRFTGDIDFFVKPSPENAARMGLVLRTFGFVNTGSVEQSLTEAGKIIQLGRPPNRIDLLTYISGVTFDEALLDSTEVEIEGVPVRMIGLESLLTNKRASNRPKDLADVSQLEKRRPESPQ